MKNLTLSLSLLKNKIKQPKEKAVILLLSVLISVLLVSTITYGATTIGNNINTGGALDVSGATTVYGATSIGGAITATSTLNVTGLTTLGNASTTQLSIAGNLWLNGFATTTSTGNINGQGILTMLGTGTSTFSGGIQSTALNITSATASSTFANGIILSKGCFLMPDGTCAGAGGGAINSGTTGQFPYYAGSGTTLTATSSIFLSSNQNIGIGTTTPNWLLQVAGTRPFFTLSDTGAAANNKHWFLSSQGGNFYLGTTTDAYATSTVSKLTILSNGNVGIGTTTPQSQFALQGNAYFAGNVGVGTTNPNYSIHIVTSLNTPGVYIDAGSQNNTNNAGIAVYPGKGRGISVIRDNSSTNTKQLLYIMESNSTPTTDIISFNNNSVGRTLYIDHNGNGNAIVLENAGTGHSLLIDRGNIGIGTTTPNWFIQIASTSPFFAITDTDSGTNQKHWLISNQSGNLYFATSSDSYATSTSNLLNLISSNYSVGIGTTSPAEQLSVSGRLFVGGTGTSTIQNNLYVMGTLRSTVSYVGDLIFSNNFKFIETLPNEKIQSLFLQNQYGENIFKLNEKGQLVVREIEAEKIQSKKIRTDEFKIGSPQNRTGITIYDEKTGKPFCLKISDGKISNKEGECK